MTDSKMQDCIEACVTCHQVCEQMIQHCLTMGGAHALVPHIRLLQDCAAICEVSADFMLRGSNFHHRTCMACAAICAACADDCARLAKDDAEMQECVDACRRCATICETMAMSH